MKKLTAIAAMACAAALLALSPGGEARAQQPLKLEGGRCRSGVVKLLFRRGASAPLAYGYSDANACTWRTFRHTTGGERLEIGGLLHKCEIGNDNTAQFRVQAPPMTGRDDWHNDWGVVVRDGWSTHWLHCSG